jgi:hypothetical protein
VLQRLAAHISDALERATACQQSAKEAATPELKAEYQKMADRWQLLARSFQFVESLERFLIDSRNPERSPSNNATNRGG